MSELQPDSSGYSYVGEEDDQAAERAEDFQNLFDESMSEWIGRAACRDCDVDFFAESPEDVQAARNICKTCIVQTECLDYALSHDDIGTWGGVTRRQRRKLLKKVTRGVFTKEQLLQFPVHTLYEMSGNAKQAAVSAWPDQAECLRAIHAAYQNGADKILFQLPTGRGKTNVAAWYAKAYLKENPNARVGYLCHRDSILAQARQRFESILGNKRTYGTFTGSTKDKGDFSCFFMSFQTMHRWYEAFPPDAFDLIIVDESHHVAAETYRPTIDYFTPNLYLAMTATVDRHDLQDIRELFGTEVYTESLTKCFADGLLAAPHYKVFVNPQEKSHIKPGGISSLNSRTFQPHKDEAMIRIVQENIAQSGIAYPRILGFTNTKDHAESLASHMPNALAWHSSNRGALAEFKKRSINALFTVGMADEGVDIPDVNVILFFGRTDSEPKFIQQLGRGARLTKKKRSFLVLDFAANCNRLFQVEKLARELMEANPKRFSIDYSGKKPVENIEESDEAVFAFNVTAVDIIKQIRAYEAMAAPEGVMDIKSFAEQYGVVIRTIYTLLEKQGIEAPMVSIGGRVMRGLTPEIQEKLLANPVFQYKPIQPEEVSLLAFGKSLRSSKSSLERILQEHGIDISTLPRRRYGGKIVTVLDPELQAFLQTIFGRPEAQLPPPGYVSVSQFRLRTHTSVSVVKRCARALGMEFIKRRVDKIGVEVISPEQQERLLEHPDFHLSVLPEGYVTIASLGRTLGKRYEPIKAAMDALGIQGKLYALSANGRGVGLSPEEQAKIGTFFEV